jgi:hypothetical protein
MGLSWASARPSQDVGPSKDVQDRRTRRQRCPSSDVSLDNAASYVARGYQDTKWRAGDRHLLLTARMHEHMCSGVIGRPSPGSAGKKGKHSPLWSGSFGPVMDVP